MIKHATNTQFQKSYFIIFIKISCNFLFITCNNIIHGLHIIHDSPTHAHTMYSTSSLVQRINKEFFAPFSLLKLPTFDQRHFTIHRTLFFFKRNLFRLTSNEKITLCKRQTVVVQKLCPNQMSM